MSVFKTHSEVGTDLVHVSARIIIPPIQNSVRSGMFSDLSFISGGLRFPFISFGNVLTVINVKEATVVRGYFTYFMVFE